jgi:hypothetical protein
MTDQNDPSAVAKRIAASVKNQIDREDRSRRTFLSRSVLAGGTLLAIGGGTGAVFASSHQDGDDGMGADDIRAMFDDVDGTDLDVLNYALTLERLEDAFYRQALETFDEDDFAAAEPLQAYSDETRRTLFGYVESFGEHEAIHVEVLTQAIELLGGEPAEGTPTPTDGTPTPVEDGFNFDIEDVSDFLALGQVLENTGVAAYAGAAPYVESPDLLSTALSIHSVEARHAALLNHLNGESPAPDAFDPASSQEEVLEAVGPFIGTGGGMGTETPGEGTETPGEGTATDTPGGGTATDTPGEGTATDTPTGGTATETPGAETATDTPGDDDTM